MAAVAMDCIVREKWPDKLPKSAVEFYDEVVNKYENVLDDNGEKTDVCHHLYIYCLVLFGNKQQ